VLEITLVVLELDLVPSSFHPEVVMIVTPGEDLFVSEEY
jgi:hypothetical protein